MRKHSWKVTACLFIGLAAAGPAHSQSPESDALAAARELVLTIRTADQFKVMMPMILKNMKPAIVQNRPEVERDFDAIMPLMLEGMNARLNELVDEITAIYARNFTADELRDATAFYQRPTGQKFLQKQATITQESMQLGQKFGQSVGSEVTNRVVEELRKRGHKM